MELAEASTKAASALQQTRSQGKDLVAVLQLTVGLRQELAHQALQLAEAMELNNAIQSELWNQQLAQQPWQQQQPPPEACASSQAVVDATSAPLSQQAATGTSQDRLPEAQDAPEPLQSRSSQQSLPSTQCPCDPALQFCEPIEAASKVGATSKLYPTCVAGCFATSALCLEQSQ
ncbi:hypothetical protein WJX84_011557 [Apatococcus fuscideae]|uniref:Uncharacterized protein n=1 Tax=Apatococcus fuscideae TaxID=2026836 RepID=A0AAW1TK60_9CHLO